MEQIFCYAGARCSCPQRIQYVRKVRQITDDYALHTWEENWAPSRSDGEGEVPVHSNDALDIRAVRSMKQKLKPSLLGQIQHNPFSRF